jgi:hypothetical protein
MKNIHCSLTKRTNANGRGQVMIEFALVLPVIVLILLGVMDLARAVYAYGVVSDAARTGAHWGSLRPLNADGTLNKNNGPDSITEHIKKQTAGLEWSRITPGIVCVQNPDNPYQKGQTPPPESDPIERDKFLCAPWNFVTVTTAYNFQPITLFFVPITLKGESTMTLE